MKAYSVMLFFICLNLSIYVLGVAEVWPSQFPEGYTAPWDITPMFSIENISLTQIGLGTIGIFAGGVLAFITRQYVFASMAVLFWIVGVFLTPIGWVITGFPLLSKGIAEGLGIISPISDIIQYTISVAYVLVFFAFILEIVGQRRYS